MKFKNTRRKASEYEPGLVKYWQDHKTFAKSVDQRSPDNAYVFYDGPPFITGVPHHGTLLSSIIKDAVPRYQTMKGKRVERTWGWDCHGLPAEVFTEQKLGIKDKRDIGTKISLEDYVVTCRDNMVQTGGLWEGTIDRIGRWVDFSGAYKTMDKDYMESVWWAFKELHTKGKIYEGEKVLLYCTRDATPISKAEVAMDNSYQDVTDPSVYVKFKLTDSERYLLAWTTTPWTLPSNSAIALNQDLDYVEVEVDGEVLVMAAGRVEQVLTDEKHQSLAHKILRTFKGNELVGLSYQQPFGLELEDERAFKVWHADFIHADDGTGIAHESPAYGEEDYQLSQQHNIPWVMSTDASGTFTIGAWAGSNVWEVNKQIAKELKEQDIVWKIEYITHSYPHCHRCGTKLMYRAHPSWFMDIEGQRAQMLEQNTDITWFPGHIKDGRFKHTVESAPDWNISRDRFWATAMPVWKGLDAVGNEQTKIIGSYQELKELSGVELEDYHRPWVDDITFEIEGVTYRRIEKVLDCWFESGSMPFAQFHYPFENVEQFEQNFPGDFIAEYISQVRAWFYYLHAINIGLFGKKAFKNVVVTGTLAGNDGRKMSKSFGNFTDPNVLMDEFSADALRFLLLSSPVLAGEDFTLTDKDVRDVNRKLAMIWNMYDFFTMYAEVDGWEWDETASDPISEVQNPLDRWIISRVHQLTQEVDEHMQAYDLPSALKPILPFVDDASNWYIRRSRRRFWKSEDDTDKNQAYQTLHYVLVRLATVIAPFTPFLAEELYRNLTGGESVHLLDWPRVGTIDKNITTAMDQVRQLVTDGLKQRAQAKIKVRQPLRTAEIQGKSASSLEKYQDILEEELNVKSVVFTEQELAESSEAVQLSIELSLEIDDDLRREGLAREIIRQVQSLRKRLGLNVDDRIVLSLQSEDAEILAAITEHSDTIKAETLATKLQDSQSIAELESVDIGGAQLLIGLEKSQ